MRDSSPFEMGNPSKAPGTFQLDIYRVYLMLFISCWPFFSLKPTEMGPSQEAGLEAVPVKEEAAASTDGGDGEAGFASVTKP